MDELRRRAKTRITRFMVEKCSEVFLKGKRHWCGLSRSSAAGYALEQDVFLGSGMIFGWRRFRGEFGSVVFFLAFARVSAFSGG